MLFNPVTIIKMARLSSLIYCSQQYPITITSSSICQLLPNERLVYFNDNKTTSVKMAISQNDHDKQVSIIFRGSETITDWKYNLQFLPKSLDKDHKKFWVHTGVHKQIYPNFDLYSNITEDIIKKVPEYDIYFTGHSSAAIQALLMAYLYSERTGREVNTIGFCGPPFINWKFRDQKQNFVKQQNVLPIWNTLAQNRWQSIQRTL